MSSSFACLAAHVKTSASFKVTCGQACAVDPFAHSLRSFSTHREAVSREISRLAAIGLLQREGGNLRVTDLEKLADSFTRRRASSGTAAATTSLVVRGGTCWPAHWHGVGASVTRQDRCSVEDFRLSQFASGNAHQHGRSSPNSRWNRPTIAT
jgi:hypothetical protein